MKDDLIQVSIRQRYRRAKKRVILNLELLVLTELCNSKGKYGSLRIAAGQVNLLSLH